MVPAAEGAAVWSLPRVWKERPAGAARGCQQCPGLILSTWGACGEQQRTAARAAPRLLLLGTLTPLGGPAGAVCRLRRLGERCWGLKAGTRGRFPAVLSLFPELGWERSTAASGRKDGSRFSLGGPPVSHRPVFSPAGRTGTQLQQPGKARGVGSKVPAPGAGTGSQPRARRPRAQ